MDFWEDDATEDDFLGKLEQWDGLNLAKKSNRVLMATRPGFFQFANWKMAFWSHGFLKSHSLWLYFQVYPWILEW